jgi:hypothetical protein
MRAAARASTGCTTAISARWWTRWADRSPVLPAGTDVADTAVWIRKVLDGAEPVPAPIATQIATIKDCLQQATRVAWASPV